MKTITSNTKTYNIYHTFGKVANTNKNMETRVHGSGGANNTNVRISSTTIVHDHLFVIDNDGQEHSFQLQGFDLACREGNEIAVAWGIKNGSNKGPYFMVHNFTTKQTVYKNPILHMMLRYPLWMALLATIFSFYLMSVDGTLGTIVLIAIWIGWFVTASQAVKKFKSEINLDEYR